MRRVPLRFLILVLPLLACAHNHGARAGGACTGIEPRPTLQDFTPLSFTYDEQTRTVYRLGSGPGVLILHEIYGLSPETLCLARRLAGRGYTVFLPHLFGTPGERGGFLGVVRMCVGRDFNCFSRRPSRILGWLRHLVPDLLSLTSNRRMGIVGLCLTGSFPLALLHDDGVRVAVLGQPSLPFNVTAGRRWELGVGDDALREAVAAVSRRDVRLLALRFYGDRISAEEKLATLKRAFGDRIEAVELVPAAGEHEHATLTYSFRPQAFNRVVEVLDRELKR